MLHFVDKDSSSLAKQHSIPWSFPVARHHDLTLGLNCLPRKRWANNALVLLHWGGEGVINQRCCVQHQAADGNTSLACTSPAPSSIQEGRHPGAASIQGRICSHLDSTSQDPPSVSKLLSQTSLGGPSLPSSSFLGGTGEEGEQKQPRLSTTHLLSCHYVFQRRSEKQALLFEPPGSLPV